jgi:hypothetical protein
MSTTLTLTKEEARDALLAALTDKFPEHTASLADQDTVVEVAQFSIRYEGTLTDPVVIEATFEE